MAASGEVVDVGNAVWQSVQAKACRGLPPLSPAALRIKGSRLQRFASSGAPDAHAASSQVSQAEDALAIRDHHNLPRSRWG